MCPSEYDSCVGHQAESDSEGRTCEEELAWVLETNPDDYTPQNPGMMEIFICFYRHEAMERCPAEDCFAIPACSDAFTEMMQAGAGGGTPGMEDPALMS